MLSPNQRAKRDEIVAAAVAVLLDGGVHACTVRAIAARAGVSKSAVHYYFDDVDGIVDQAMLKATQGWIAWLRAGGSDLAPRIDSSSRRFWLTVNACLAPFAAGDRSLLPLWLEYWAVRARQGRLGELRLLADLLTGYVEELLGLAGISDASGRALGVTAYLLGISMWESLGEVDLVEVERHVGAIAGLVPPRTEEHQPGESG
ncbi:MAG: TetR/AcrR family transcriptional regulator [Actinobacteria bacterium]|nr:TetR/AcrR family transcriptional regulator [Actinomycetota bacterium]